MLYPTQTPIDFSKQLIKGKVAEMIFDQMFRRVSTYTVIPFGYEAIIPELMQYAEREDRNVLMENIRNAPDFALVSHDPKSVLLVEVKYRTRIDMEEVKDTARRICRQWKLAQIFYATPNGFFFDSCSDIEGQDSLTPLDTDTIPAEIQSEYIKLLKDFI